MKNKPDLNSLHSGPCAPQDLSSFLGGFTCAFQIYILFFCNILLFFLLWLWVYFYSLLQWLQDSSIYKICLYLISSHEIKRWLLLGKKVITNLLLLSRFSHVWLCVTSQTAAYQVPPSLGFSRKEHWSGLPFPSPVHESEKWKWSRSVMSDP